MKSTTCINCGKPIPPERRKYCCNRCGKTHWARDRYAKTQNACIYNEGILCTKRACQNCGWNPVVAQERQLAIINKGVKAC